MLSSTQVGSNAETLACEYLKRLEYKIIERNYRIRGGEIDIVARDGEFLVFVEVKARYSHEYGLPVEAITPWKIKHLLKTAQFYVQKIKWEDGPYRLDLVAIDYADSRDNPKIELIEDITNK